jgi:hypothetical protein
MPRIMPEARYFSMPSTEVGAEVKEAGLELLAMGAVVRPVAGGRNPLASGDHGGVANDGDEIAVTTCLDPNDAKAVVGILIGDALNQSGQHFPIEWLRLRLLIELVPVVWTTFPRR